VKLAPNYLARPRRFVQEEFDDIVDDARCARGYQDAQAEAAVDHIFGVPIFIFEGEPFWGHDRLSLLEERLREKGLALSE